MDIEFAFDFQNVLVESESAWKQAFKKYSVNPRLFDALEKGASQKKLCQEFALDYLQVEKEYLKYIKLKYENIEFAKRIGNCGKCYIVSATSRNELMRQIEILGIESLFDEIYSNEDFADINAFLKKLSENVDWLIYFNNNKDTIYQQENVIWISLPIANDPAIIGDQSFTEHARTKVFYNKLSDIYLKSIANNTYKEVHFIEKVMTHFGMPQHSLILDCCCGVGRHDILLAKDGYRVHGVDFSYSQISTAKRIHNHNNIVYHVMDVRNVNLLEISADVVICMWTTYNYFSLDNDLRLFFASCYESQDENGIMILESKNIPALEAFRTYKRSKVHKEEGLAIDVIINKRILGDVQNSQYFYFINDKGKKSFYRDEEFVRFYNLNELATIASPYYSVEEVYGDFDGNPYDEKKSERFITVLKRNLNGTSGKIESHN